MNISKERLKSFLKAWATKFWDNILDAVTITKTVVSILTIFGLTAANVPYASVLYFGVAGYIVFLVYKSLPKLHVYPGDIANRRIELQELDALLTPIPSVGLLGKTEVGKTTFLYSATGRKREEPKRQTEKPYALIVQLPDTSPPQYIALLDSVGEQDDTQYEILRRSQIVCIFVDHNSLHRSAKSYPIQRRRLDEHRYLLQQLIRSRRSASAGASTIILVANKQDLWTQTTQSETAMRAFFTESMNMLEASNLFQVARGMPDFSAISGHDSARLLEEIRHAL